MKISPKFIEHIHLDLPIKPVNETSTDIYNFIQKAAVHHVEKIDAEIIKQICDIARQEGIADVYVLDKTNIMSALKKQIPKKPRETRCALMCANCGHKITEKGCKKLNRFYCKKCGQALDWSDGND